MERTERLTRATRLGLICNVWLALLKVTGGVVGRSSALLADGFNSMADVGTDLAALWGLHLVAQPEDWDHRYGHGKFETLAAAGMGVALLVLGVSMFAGGLRGVLEVTRGELPPRPGVWTLAVAVFTVALKELLYRVTIRAARETGSDLLLSKAWDHRSDALATTGVMAGVAGALWLGRWGAALDPLAACGVSFLVLRVGWFAVSRSVRELSEGAPPEMGEHIASIIRATPGVVDFHHLRFRSLGGYLAMDFHILVDGSASLRQAHTIASVLEDALKRRFGPRTLITIHEEPTDRPISTLTQVTRDS